MLNRFLKGKEDAARGPVEKRPYLASLCEVLGEAEGWRRGFASSPGTDGSGDGSGGGERADAMRIL